MFLSKYLSERNYNILLNNNSYEYLESLDEENFLKIYNLFRKYVFYFIDDIILRYLDIFEMDEKKVEEGILKLKEKLGDNYIYIIGEDLRYLNDIIETD